MTLVTDEELYENLITWLKNNITNPNKTGNWIYPNYPMLTTTKHRISLAIIGSTPDNYVGEDPFDWKDVELILWIKGGKTVTIDTTKYSGMELLTVIGDEIINKLRKAIDVFKKNYDVHYIRILDRSVLPFDPINKWYRLRLVIRFVHGSL